MKDEERGGSGTEDARLREVFGALRRADEAYGPPFARTWAAAKRRSASRPAPWKLLVAVTGVGFAGATVAVAAVALVGLSIMRGSGPETVATAPAAAIASSATDARSAVDHEPLAFLLHAPATSVVGAPLGLDTPGEQP